MKEIDVKTFKKMQDEGTDFQLIDVRESNEYEAANLGGILIPLATVLDSADKIARDKMVVVHCRSGKRSASAIQALENHFGFDNLYNLTGGIMAYGQEFDPSKMV